MACGYTPQIICSNENTIFYIDFNSTLKTFKYLNRRYESITLASNPKYNELEFNNIENCKEVCSMDYSTLLLLNDGNVIYNYFKYLYNDYIINIIKNLVNIVRIACTQKRYVLLDLNGTLHVVNTHQNYQQYHNIIDFTLGYTLYILSTNFEVSCWYNEHKKTLPNFYKCLKGYHQHSALITTSDSLELYNSYVEHELYFVYRDPTTCFYTKSEVLDVCFIDNPNNTVVCILSKTQTVELLSFNDKTLTYDTLNDVDINAYFEYALYNKLNTDRSIIGFITVMNSVILKLEDSFLYSKKFNNYINFDNTVYLINFPINQIKTIVSVELFVFVVTHANICIPFFEKNPYCIQYESVCLQTIKRNACHLLNWQLMPDSFFIQTLNKYIYNIESFKYTIEDPILMNNLQKITLLDTDMGSYI